MDNYNSMNNLQKSIQSVNSLPEKEQVLKDYFKSIDPVCNPIIIYIGLSKSSLFPDGTFGGKVIINMKTGKTFDNGIDRLHKEQGQTYDSEVFVLVKEYVIPNLKVSTSKNRHVNLEDFLRDFSGNSNYVTHEKAEFVTIEIDNIPGYLKEIEDYLDNIFGGDFSEAKGCFGLTMPYFDYIPEFVERVRKISLVDRSSMSVSCFNEYKDSIFSDYINSNAEFGSAMVRRQIKRINENPGSFSANEKSEIDRIIQSNSSSKLNSYSKLMREIRKTIVKDQEDSKSNIMSSSYQGNSYSITPTGIHCPNKFILTKDNVNSRDFTKKYPGVANGQVFYVNSYNGERDASGKLQGNTYRLIVTDAVKGKVSEASDISKSFYITPFVLNILAPEVRSRFTKGTLQWIRYVFFDKDCTKSVDNWLTELEVLGVYEREDKKKHR